MLCKIEMPICQQRDIEGEGGTAAERGEGGTAAERGGSKPALMLQSMRISQDLACRNVQPLDDLQDLLYVPAAHSAYPASRYCGALWIPQGQAWQERSEVLASGLETGLASSEQPQLSQPACHCGRVAHWTVPVLGLGMVLVSRLQDLSEQRACHYRRAVWMQVAGPRSPCPRSPTRWQSLRVSKVVVSLGQRRLGTRQTGRSVTAPAQMMPSMAPCDSLVNTQGCQQSLADPLW